MFDEKWKDTSDTSLVDQHPQWRRVGYFAVFFYSLATGFQTAGALVLMHVVAGVALYILAPILLIATVVVNWRICRVAVPAIFIRLFANDIDEKDEAFHGLFPQEKQRKKRSIGLASAMVGALATGTALGALTIQGTLSTLGTFAFLSSVSSVFPIVALFFGVTVFICVSFLMLRSLRRIVKNWDWEEYKRKTRNFFNTLKFSMYHEKFKYEYKLDHDGNKIIVGLKKNWIIKAEYGITLFLWIIFIPMTLMGLGMGLWTCSQQLITLMAQALPQISMIAIQIFSIIISMVLAFLAQIPFYIETATKAAVTMLGFLEYPFPHEKSTGTFSYLKKSGVFLVRIITGVGNGMIAMLSMLGHLVLAFFGGAGAFISTLAASQYNEDVKNSRFNDTLSDPPGPIKSPSDLMLPPSSLELPVRSGVRPDEGKSPLTPLFQRGELQVVFQVVSECQA